MLDDQSGLVDPVLVLDLLEQLPRTQSALLRLLALVQREVGLRHIEQRVSFKVRLMLLDGQLQSLLGVLLRKLPVVFVDVEARQHQQGGHLLRHIADGLEEWNRFQGRVNRVLQQLGVRLQAPVHALLDDVHVQVGDLQGRLRLLPRVLGGPADPARLPQDPDGAHVVLLLAVPARKRFQRHRLTGCVPDLLKHLLRAPHLLRSLAGVPDVALHDLGQLEQGAGLHRLALVVVLPKERYGFPGPLHGADAAPVPEQDLGHGQERRGLLLVPAGLMVQPLLLL
mmetsp:Transcript_116662/g.310369  ORF Transcript_116662/g.310369 Transcript_116662/m.310369 type:complete len:282 (-) Transcript_116662:246-1091(-)